MTARSTFHVVLAAALTLCGAWEACAQLYSFPVAPRARHALRNQQFGLGARTYSGVRTYEDETVYTDPLDKPPYQRGEWSYGVVYEYHEKPSLWQFALSYAPDSEVLEPQVNLLYQDRGVRAGVGGLTSYQWNERDDWNDVYWQVLTGLNLGGTRLSIDVYACYVFASWGDLEAFDWDNLDYAVWGRFSF